MAESDEEVAPSTVPFRPYSASLATSIASAQRPPKQFRPTLPSESREVGRVVLSSSSYSENSAHSLLQNAWRHQEATNQAAASSGARSSGGFRNERYEGMSLKKFGVGTSIPGAAGTAGMASGNLGNVVPPRQMKERKEGSSMSLMDLAFMPKTKYVDGEVKSHYAPISLPYYTVMEEEDENAENLDKKRPGVVHIDEANANAAKQLFLDGAGQLVDDTKFLMQLPSVLPDLLDPLERVQRENEDAATAGAGSTITTFPDGKLGKLRIHKSGKVRLEIGGMEFCVEQGCETFFQQDLACVCPQTNEIIDLGPIRKRMVLTPDLDSIMASPGDVPASSAAPTVSTADAPA